MLKLDQFFTKPATAEFCWKSLLDTLRYNTGKEKEDFFYIEPSAGDGVFFDLFPDEKNNKIGLDIMPLNQRFIEMDFLRWEYKDFPCSRSERVVIGNPPFGKRGDKAVEFINKAASISDTIAFIVPVIFRKYFIHKQLNKELRLIFSQTLEKNSFRTFKKNDYSVNTEFQIWTRLESKGENLRLFKALPIAHKDFTMWQYNNTPQAEKVFSNSFDFAVPCQGWQDYKRKEKDSKRCERKKQWMLLAAKNKQVLRRLLSIDYEKLASTCATSVPGFRKGDLVREYSLRYN